MFALSSDCCLLVLCLLSSFIPCPHQSFSFFRFHLQSWVDPLSSAEPFLFVLASCRAFLTGWSLCSCLCRASLITRLPELSSLFSANHAPSTPSIASPSCSRTITTSWHVQIYDAIGADAHLSSDDSCRSESSPPRASAPSAPYQNGNGGWRVRMESGIAATYYDWKGSGIRIDVFTL